MICTAFQAQDTITKNDWRVFPSKKVVLNDSTRQASSLVYNKNGSVEVKKDTRITSVEKQMADHPYIYGYTVQLEVSQQKAVIKDARYKILKIKPEVDLDDPYEAPNIYLYAGRFYDRVSAYQFKNEIAKYFPNAIVVGPRKMDLPSISMPQPVIKNDTISSPQGLEGGMGQ